MSCFLGCTKSEHPSAQQPENNPIFVAINPDSSRVKFSNRINDLRDFTPFNTLYIYNGGGVAAGDLDNDGLPDLVFTSNQNPSKVYKNLGGFEFEDLTEPSGFSPKHPWVTGVSLVDVNADGWLDIYVCRAGNEGTLDKKNQLYINNQDFTFSEKAADYGLDEDGASTQAYFFDYDNDGDLDAFVVSHPSEFKRAVDFYYYTNFVKDEQNRDKLFRNDDGFYRDVTESSGILGDNGFGLSATIIDANNDGYDDIFVANDFFAPDRLFINQKDGTFKDEFKSYFKKMSLFSMGSDQADYDLDGDYDLLVADMAPLSMKEMKTHMFDLPLDWYIFNSEFFKVEQVTRNMLYAKTLDEYVDVGQMENVSRTDWSWSVFMEDFRNQEYPEVFITNGLKRDFHDNDYSKKNFDDKAFHLFQGTPDQLKLVEEMPARTIENQFFVRDDRGRFQKSNGLFENNNWNSQGAALADLDLDGDLDVILNNTDITAVIYENLTNEGGASGSVRLRMIDGINTYCVGCEAFLYYEGRIKKKRLFPTRGFQSSSEPILHFGLPSNIESVDSIVVIWSDKRSSTHKRVPIDKVTTLNKPKDCRIWTDNAREVKGHLLEPKSFKGLAHKAQKLEHTDFRDDKLNPLNLSSHIPPIDVADFDDNGLDDVLLGGAHNHKAIMFLQTRNGEFLRTYPFESDSAYQDVLISVVDLNYDGYKDVYVASGGNMFPKEDPLYQDRIYLNDGQGNFQRCVECEPELYSPTGTVSFEDLNEDGYPDIFIGARHEPHHYGLSAESHIFLNKAGRLTELDTSMHLGMITDSDWFDIDEDGDKDLLIVGEWSSPMVLQNDEGSFELVKDYFKGSLNGLWRALSVFDWNGDGMEDIILGNYGLNSVLRASPKQAMMLYGGDFDNSGSYEPIITHFIDGEEGFFPFRSEFCQKMPKFNGVFRTNKEFAESNMESVLQVGGRLDVVRSVSELRSGVLLKTEGGYEFQPFEHKLQSAPINTFMSLDNNLMLIGGNTMSNYYREGSTITMPLSVLRRGAEGMTLIPEEQQGFRQVGVIGEVGQIQISGEPHVIFLPANDSIVTLQLGEVRQ